MRVPIVLSTAALVVAVLGTTPLGHAAGERLTAAVPFAKTAGFAKIAGNSAKLNGRRSALSGAPGTIPVVGKDGKLAASLGAVGPRGPQGERGPQGPTGSAGGSSGSGGGRPSGGAGGGLTGSYPNPLIAPNAIASAQVVDNSLTGADLNESTLAQVPLALLGGLGRSGTQGGNRCDPETVVGFATCASVTLNLPVPTRVLLLARLTGRPENSADSGHGFCRLATSTSGVVGDRQSVRSLAVTASGLRFEVGGDTSFTVVTPTLGPGPVSFRVECQQEPIGAIVYDHAVITAVALSPS